MAGRWSDVGLTVAQLCTISGFFQSVHRSLMGRLLLNVLNKHSVTRGYGMVKDAQWISHSLSSEIA